MSDPGEAEDRATPEMSAVSDAARKLASGEVVDWAALEASARDEGAREALAKLQDVDEIAGFFRTWPGGRAAPTDMPPDR